MKRSRDTTLSGRRVLFVLPSLGYGGAERQASLLARHLAEVQGAQVGVVGFRSTATLAHWFDHPLLATRRFRLFHRDRNRGAQAVDLARFVIHLKRHRVQIVLPYCMFPNVLSGLAAPLAGARICVWNQRDEGRFRVEPWVERLALKGVSAFVSNSQHGAEFLIGTLGVDRARVEVVHNGIEPRPVADGREASPWRRRLGLEPGDALACMVANLHQFKDHWTLIDAWALVAQRSSCARPHLALAGAFGDRYEACLRQVQALGLKDLVHFCGQIDDVPGLLAECDIAVFSSRAEGLPNAVLEAMSQSLPVVATDYPGIREAVGPDGRELLAAAGDSAGLAERILTALGDRELRQRLGRVGRKRVEDEFSVEAMCRRSVGILERCLER